MLRLPRKARSDTLQPLPPNSFAPSILGGLGPSEDISTSECRDLRPSHLWQPAGPMSVAATGSRERFPAPTVRLTSQNGCDFLRACDDFVGPARILPSAGKGVLTLRSLGQGFINAWLASIKVGCRCCYLIARRPVFILLHYAFRRATN